jgi:acyl-CoA reductase-like NAD-dependent aldehyde dehydrogenase
MEAREALLDRVSAADGDTEIKDPATGEVIGRHTFGAAADVKAAVGVAAAAQPAWAALTDEERVGYLMRCADNMEAHAEELAYAVSPTWTLKGSRRACSGARSSTTGRPAPRSSG